MRLQALKTAAAVSLALVLLSACKSGTPTTTTPTVNPNSIDVTEIKVWAQEPNGTPIQINGTYKNAESEDVWLTGTIAFGDNATGDLSNKVLVKANTEKSWTIEALHWYAGPVMNTTVTIKVSVSVAYKAGTLTDSLSKNWYVN